MATLTGITRSSLKIFSQPQLHPQPLLFFSKGFSAKVFVKGILPPFLSSFKILAIVFAEFKLSLATKMKRDLELLAFTSHLQSLHKPVYSFAAGLSFSSTEKKIVEAFSEFGEVIEVMDKARKRPKGYGFVTFAKKDAAEKACEGMNGKLLDGRAIYVRF
ncbi:hypothetical protein POTOM_035113 [Populus tomentosa]|uniref:RRM domain-containing protein n=1 Tax=Populus tomentosa TaxID=118781 RepID=A0A8X8CPQ8_POPTO|nr:hypothetical protein POTOM_035113 [Populus tomentosa]